MSGVLLEVFLVLRPRGRRDRAQRVRARAPVEQVCGIAESGGAACPDQRVRLVDEQNDAAGDACTSMTWRSRLSNSPHAGAGLQKSDVEHAQCDVFKTAAICARAERKPSTTAVCYRPAGEIGLFCRRRIKMSMICRISSSRPTMLSISPPCLFGQVDGILLERFLLAHCAGAARRSFHRARAPPLAAAASSVSPRGSREIDRSTPRL